MFGRRGHSEEPELSSHRSPVKLASDGQQMPLIGTDSRPPPPLIGTNARSRSAGPTNRRHKRPPNYGEAQQQQQQQQQAERAVLRINVNPYQELPSLRYYFLYE